ncbi:MAG: hypothetical protein DPW16_13805 [Chloroflexi bacterium]|nr:hypothetical protein [Chloroflexota bacterium]
MHSFGKFVATMTIWLAFLGVMIAVFASDAATTLGGGNVVAVIAILAIAAVLGTAAVNTASEHDSREQAERKKLKRTEQGRIERLMQLMDEDDIVELEEVLKEREVAAIRRTDN